MNYEPRPIPAQQRIKVELEAQQWNTIMTLLSEAPYRISAPLIRDIQQQCLATEE